jgi:small-conductance mechanosensitive channel
VTGWQTVLVVALASNAVLGLGYRVYRLTKKGPVTDVVGQAVLAAILLGLAVAAATDAGWPRWGALAYALLFGLIVMPVWTLAVLLPLPPGKVDYAFTGVYWATLAAIALAAILV